MRTTRAALRVARFMGERVGREDRVVDDQGLCLAQEDQLPVPGPTASTMLKSGGPFFCHRPIPRLVEARIVPRRGGRGGGRRSPVTRC